MHEFDPVPARAGLPQRTHPSLPPVQSVSRPPGPLDQSAGRACNTRTATGIRLVLLLTILLAPLLVTLGALPARPAAAAEAPIDVTDLEAELTSREAQLVAAVNLKRREAGLLPLRWNREMSEAARWFARDAVLTQPNCGHEDSLGRGPGARLRAFGYTNIQLWGETVACGFTEPLAAVSAWMYAEYQRSVLLNPAAREAGVGYYYSQEKGRGYIVFDAAADPTFGPVVINDEAIVTPSSAVRLTIHPQSPAAVAMKVANSPDLAAVPWEPFTTDKAWTLAPGSGWRSVYVLLRDANNRTQLLSDVIYLGEAISKSEISLAQATSIGSAFSVANVAQIAPALRLSLGWAIDNSDPGFLVYRGPQLTEPDPSAEGGSAVRLIGDERQGLARAALTTLPLNKLLTAYFRLKVSDNQGSGEVARLVVRADEQVFGPLVLQANDFKAAEQWQEFAVDFSFPMQPLSAELAVEVQRTGAADVVVDVVRFYGQPLPTSSPIVWTTGESNFRSQGLLARAQTAAGVGDPFYLVGTPVDGASQVPGVSPTLQPSPAALVFSANDGVVEPLSAAVIVCGAWCADLNWQGISGAPWLQITPSYEGMIVRALPNGLAKGVYDTFIAISPTTGSAGGPLAIAVRLVVDGAPPPPDGPPIPPVIQIKERVYLPTALKP